MFTPDKLNNALYALHGILIRARALANEHHSGPDLVALLDYAEYLPRLIAESTDETSRYRAILEEVGERFHSAYVVERFDKPPPRLW